MRKALIAVLFLSLAGCLQAGGSLDGSVQTCKSDSDCPSMDAGTCDACPFPGNYSHCQSGYCCCTCQCES
jgi:hypothetical protein